MTEKSELTFVQKQFDYDLLLLRENDPVKADIYYYRLIKERNRMREEEGRFIGLEERMAIYQTVVDMSEEEVEAQQQIMKKEQEERNNKRKIEEGIRREKERIQKTWHRRTWVDYVSEAMEKKEEEKE